MGFSIDDDSKTLTESDRLEGGRERRGEEINFKAKWFIITVIEIEKRPH